MDTTVASQFVGKGPPRPGEDRKISGGPLYKAGDVLYLLRQDSLAIKFWTRKCRLDVLNWQLEDEDIRKLVRVAVNSPDRFHDSEWCLQEADGPWAACDAYLVRWEWKLHARIRSGMKFYVKFAIHCTNRKLLLVSCHPSKEWRKER